MLGLNVVRVERETERKRTLTKQKTTLNLNLHFERWCLRHSRVLGGSRRLIRWQLWSSVGPTNGTIRPE